MIPLKLSIAQPIRLKLSVSGIYQLIPDQIPASENLFKTSEAFKLTAGDKAKLDAQFTVLTGEKKTGTDGGTFPSISITNDYLYVLVQEGDPGQAIWKKTILFQT